ncbi:zinc finger and BTB domain-containing protein 10 [Sardina pilchardus]|uniref:zinc finger and BTB domain-containing protein 10 n=1 Tax=Sardina pilchardus TaxID=27697 RepID=UPI002E12A037
MSGERNRRSLAFRGGGLAATGPSGSGGSNSNSWEAQACQDRHLNGNRPDQDEDRVLGAKGPSLGKVEGGGSVGDSTEPEAEEEEDPEGGNSLARDGGEDRVGWTTVSVGEDGSREGGIWTPGNGLNTEDRTGLGSGATGSEDDKGEAGSGGDTEETGVRKPMVEMRPQTLLQKHSLFQGSWLQEFPWLKFCQETGLMSCSWCHNIATNNSDELVKGSRNYKRALLLRHHLSSEHGRNDPTKQEVERVESPAQGSVDGEDSRRPQESSYCYQLLQELDKQRKSGILCDVSVVVSGQAFRAHKNILVAGSRYFKTLFCLTKSEGPAGGTGAAGPEQSDVTHLDVAAVQGFSVILDFLYSGNLLLTSQNAIEVMSVASYLQMTEVVQSCRAFIKDALNISIKQEAPDSVVVDYNKRRTVAKDGTTCGGGGGGSDKKPSNFWATSILSKLSIKASAQVQVKEEPSDASEVSANDSCAPGGGDTPESTDEAEMMMMGAGAAPVFVWNEPALATGVSVKPEPGRTRTEPGSGRRKRQTTRRFVYNIPPEPEPEEGFDQGMFIQPSASYTREDYFLSDTAGETADVALNKLKCPHCNYIAKHRRTLKRHLIIHSGVRSFSCDICGKLFTRREHVKRHSLVHKKDKKYKCMVCKKIFMLAASVGIRHGSRRYGVCVDCADSHQASQEALQELELSRGDDDDFEGDDDMMAEDNDEPGDGDHDNDNDNEPIHWDAEATVTPDDD